MAHKDRTRAALETAVRGNREGSTANRALADYYIEHGLHASAAEQMRQAQDVRVTYVARVKGIPKYILGSPHETFRAMRQQLASFRYRTEQETNDNIFLVRYDLLGPHQEIFPFNFPYPPKSEPGLEEFWVRLYASPEFAHPFFEGYRIPFDRIEIAVILWRPELLAFARVGEFESGPAPGSTDQLDYYSATTVLDRLAPEKPSDG